MTAKSAIWEEGLSKRNGSYDLATNLDVNTQSQVSTSTRRIDNVKECSSEDGSNLDWALAKSMKKKPDTTRPRNQIDIKQTYCQGGS